MDALPGPTAVSLMRGEMAESDIFRDGNLSNMVGSPLNQPMSVSGSATPLMTPHQLAERILREHEARRQASPVPWSWDDDPDGANLVALAAMVTRWNVDDQQFEAKLRRLIRLPTGVARPAAERMLALWQESRQVAPE
jgi:hypothetical protein